MGNFWSGLFSKKGTEGVSASSSLTTVSDGPSENSLRDDVTGLYNRKHLLQRLASNMAKCLRTNERMAVILWDIDGFVDFNNRFGKEKGDSFLVKVADLLKRSLRSYDEAFRAGGDEFCAILVPADETLAKDVTERIRQSVSKELFMGDSEYANHQFSISSGLVFSPGDSHMPEALLHEAQQALYRNRLARK